VVQPALHVKSCASQMGMAVPQSALLKQSTHWPSASRQRGWVEGQSLLAAHSTHCCVVGSQMGWPAPQSVWVRHPTQIPAAELMSQIGAFIGQFVLLAHAAWQVWSAGQHAGVAAGHCPLVRHSAHCPVPVTQKGAVAGQAEFVMQSTQPSVALHV
jgi:hypothetical protein